MIQMNRVKYTLDNIFRVLLILVQLNIDPMLLFLQPTQLFQNKGLVVRLYKYE